MRKIEKFGKNDVDDDMQTYSDVSSDKDGEFDNNVHDQRTQSKDAKGKSKSGVLSKSAKAKENHQMRDDDMNSLDDVPTGSQ